MDRVEQFQWLFLTEYPAVVRTTYLVLHDHGLAEEITQDAFVQLLKHWDKVRDYESPGAWVRRVAIRLAIRHARREGRRGWLTQAAMPDRPTQSPDAGVADELLNAIRKLSPQQRSVVVLFYYEDRPMGEIAEILGCSVATGWVHLHKARKRLGLLLNEEVGTDVG